MLRILAEHVSVGTYLGHAIYKVSSLEILPCDHTLNNSSREQRKLEVDLSSLLNAAEKMLGLCFSYDANLTLREDFKDYAELCFKLFGDQVKHWVTLNEPWTFFVKGYSDGLFTPRRCSPSEAGHCSVGDSSREAYLAAHNQLLSHVAAVQFYRNKYQASQKRKVWTTLNYALYLPYSTRSKQELDVADEATDFNLGRFMEPVSEGDYPFNTRAIVGDCLPQFTREQSKMLKGSFDFLGLNYYTSNYA